MTLFNKRLILFITTLISTIFVVALLINIFEHKQEAKLKYLKIVDIPEDELDPKVWKQNFPREYDSYIKTQSTKELMKYSKWGRYGGSENFSKLDKYPDLKLMFAGYAFSVEYNEERGHMFSLADSLSRSSSSCWRCTRASPCAWPTRTRG
jgi:nitrite reductase (cytochrome c-552)